jgi:fluoride exporter
VRRAFGSFSSALSPQHSARSLLWFIAIGSAVGGVSRYLLGSFVGRQVGPGFPLGTMLINITGSLLVGLLYRYAADSAAISAELRAGLTIGFCGGYTTFSSFSYETVKLMEDGQMGRAGLYVAASVLLSIGATVLGIALGRELVQLRRG